MEHAPGPGAALLTPMSLGVMTTSRILGYMRQDYRLRVTEWLLQNWSLYIK
jgi:hypothetical protein